MYEMYPWHRAGGAAGDAGRDAAPGAPRGARPANALAARAVQVALDRRDNGGEAAAARAE